MVQQNPLTNWKYPFKTIPSNDHIILFSNIGLEFDCTSGRWTCELPFIRVLDTSVLIFTIYSNEKHQI